MEQESSNGADAKARRDPKCIMSARFYCIL